ncbi:MAG TPA: GAF domain-containing protein [Thermoflexia bacterium]|nr:GAF domain-containing protein [Thermoflexia bacterium]
MTRVLVVDDELGIREAFQMLLEEEGYDVATAAGFFEAELLLIERPFDVVVTDIIMPHVNGLALLQRVREIDKSIPVIMVTGKPDASTAAEAVRYGAYDYIAKPVTLDMLLHVVGRAAEKKRLLDEKRRLEVENLAYQSDLERKVAERTVELERRNKELAVLIDIGRDISATLDLTTVLKWVAQRAAQVCEANRCTILLLEKGGEVAVPLMSRFADERMDREMWRLFKDASYPIPVDQVPEAQRVVRERQPLFIPDASASSLPKHLIESFGIASVLLIPLTSKEHVIGLMALDQVEEGREFTPAQVDLALAIAAQATIAVENARLFEAEQQRRQEAETLYRATQALATTTLDLPQVFECILSELEQVVPYDSASVQLLQDDRLEIIGGRGFPNLDELLGITFDLSKEDNPNREVIHRGAPFIVDDAPAVYSRFHQEPHAAAGVRAWLGVPLLFGERLIGMLALDKREAGFYTPGHARLAEAFAAQAAIAVENARLYDAAQREIAERKRAEEALQERAARLELVARVGQRTTAILDLDELLDQAANLIGDTFEYYNVNVFLVEGDAIALRASTFPSYSPSERLVRLRVGAEGITGWVAAHGEPLLAPDVSVEPRYHITLEGIETRSELAVPIKLKGLVIGVLDVQSAQLDAFSQADLFTLQTVAGQLAIAIENAHLYEEAKRHVDELVALHNIDVAITSVLDPDEIAQVVYEQVSEVMGATTFYIGLYDEGQGELDLPFVVEEGERLSLPALPIGEGGGLTGWVVRAQQPLWIEDMEKERDTLPVEPISEGVPPRSLMMWPLVARDKVVGVISAQSVEPYAFDESHRRLLSGIASQVAIAVENARLFEETNRRLDELSLLHDVAIASATTLDFDEILCRTVEAVHSRLNLEVFGFLLVDEEAGVARLHSAFLGVPDELVDFSTPLGEGITGWVAQTGQPLLAPDISREPRYQDAIPGTRSEICVPLKVGGKVVGVMDAESTRLNAFSEDDVRLFSTLASQLGVALDNARLFEETNRRLAEARLIQEVVLAAASTLDFDLVFERTAKALNRALGIERLGFLLPDERNGVLAPHPSLVGFAGAAFQIPIKGSLTGRAYRTGQPILVRDLAQEPVYERRVSDVRSALAVPVRIADRIAAILHAESTQAGAFGEDELLLFVTIAGQLGVTLHNAQLYSQLQETDRLRTELVQNVGHELRTPLGIIKGYVELLRDGDLGPILDDQQSALQIVHGRIVALSRLIHNLTVLQTLPREALTLAPISLVEVVQRALEEFRVSAARANITFLENLPTTLPDKLPDVIGDREQLELAFGHLLDNAIKFSPNGGTVTIRAWAERSVVCVSIADEGIGILSEHLDRIFERFYQVDGSASRRFGGMGVGLALVWEIIEAHGGTVSVDSEAREGSTFIVALPHVTGSENS